MVRKYNSKKRKQKISAKKRKTRKKSGGTSVKFSNYSVETMNAKELDLTQQDIIMNDLKRCFPTDEVSYTWLKNDNNNVFFYRNSDSGLFLFFTFERQSDGRIHITNVCKNNINMPVDMTYVSDIFKDYLETTFSGEILTLDVFPYNPDIYKAIKL